jgi:hypothetical protein
MGWLLQWLHEGWLSMLIGWDKFVVWCFTPPSKVKIPWTFSIHPQWKIPWSFHWCLKDFPLSTCVVGNTVWKQWRKTLQLCKFSSCGYTWASHQASMCKSLLHLLKFCANPLSVLKMGNCTWETHSFFVAQKVQSCKQIQGKVMSKFKWIASQEVLMLCFIHGEAWGGHHNGKVIATYLLCPEFCIHV